MNNLCFLWAGDQPVCDHDNFEQRRWLSITSDYRSVACSAARADLRQL
jgi:hypothetical protein